MNIYNNFFKAVVATRDGGKAIVVNKTDEFVIYGNDFKRFSGSFQVIENGKAVSNTIPYFEARS